jgi:hypothetical protein
LRPLRRRNDFRAGSVHGDFDEFREFMPKRRYKSAFSARNAAISTSNRAIVATYRATRRQARHTTDAHPRPAHHDHPAETITEDQRPDQLRTALTYNLPYLL